ncbi:MAG: hypothetical protein ABSB71_11170 [Candidatus Bathyarchaeia archaeon]
MNSAAGKAATLGAKPQPFTLLDSKRQESDCLQPFGYAAKGFVLASRTLRLVRINKSILDENKSPNGQLVRY